MLVIRDGTAAFSENCRISNGVSLSLSSRIRRKSIIIQITDAITKSGIICPTVSDILAQLSQILEQRKQSDPAASYVAGLYNKGLDAILKKIGEEATELVVAAKGGDNRQIIFETADLWFHTLVLLAHSGLSINEVMAELEKRYGTSGLDEKARRQVQS